jgi:hypothetical protein
MIFSSADNGDVAFTNAIVRKYAKALCEGRYEMRALPQGHELFSGELFAKISTPPQVVGLSNEVREWWVHSAVDMGGSWQGRKFGIKEHFFFPANVVRYATGNGSLRNKLEGLPVAGTMPEVGRTIALARVEYAGNWDPEPGAWGRLAAFAPKRFKTKISVNAVKIAELDVAKTLVAHMTGTAGFELTDAEVKVLKKFLDGGGTLIADSAGASAKFTASFARLMLKLYPESPASELAINDPVFNGSLEDSIKLTEVEYRKFALLKMKERVVKARILGVTVNSRHVILFSPEDLTSGLLGTDTWGIRGYASDSAAHLARNLLLYSAAK